MPGAVVVVFAFLYNLGLTLGWDFRSPQYNGVLWFLTPGLILGKVYSNSMLALLNSRLTIVGGRNTGDPFVVSEIRSEILRTEVRG